MLTAGGSPDLGPRLLRLTRPEEAWRRPAGSWCDAWKSAHVLGTEARPAGPEKPGTRDKGAREETPTPRQCEAAAGSRLQQNLLLLKDNVHETWACGRRGGGRRATARKRCLPLRHFKEVPGLQAGASQRSSGSPPGPQASPPRALLMVPHTARWGRRRQAPDGAVPGRPVLGGCAHRALVSLCPRPGRTSVFARFPTPSPSC